jgi:four helix bundle protein
MQDFRELKVWQKAHQLTLKICSLTASSPRAEAYGLTAQLRRSRASIPANLAEGRGRGGDAEFAHFCSIAIGSAAETEYHLLLAKELNLIRLEEYEKAYEQSTEVRRMLTALRQKLRNRS